MIWSKASWPNKFVIAITLLLVCQSLRSQDGVSLMFEGPKALIATQSAFAIVVDDQVKGGCLPNPGRLKDKAEISLRKNGFRVLKEQTATSSDLMIYAIGYKVLEDSCVVYLRVDLGLQATTTVPFAADVPGGDKTIITYVHTLGGSLFSGSKASMQGRLANAVEEYADNLFLVVSRSRDDIFQKYPPIEESFTGWESFAQKLRSQSEND